jgi:hypothetical protein
MNDVNDIPRRRSAARDDEPDHRTAKQTCPALFQAKPQEFIEKGRRGPLAGPLGHPLVRRNEACQWGPIWAALAIQIAMLTFRLETFEEATTTADPKALWRKQWRLLAHALACKSRMRGPLSARNPVYQPAGSARRRN